MANFSRIVPDGMVVFLPSFRVLERVKSLWEQKGIMGSILKKKKVPNLSIGRSCVYTHDAGVRRVVS